MMTRRSAWVGVLCAAALLAGCSGGGEGADGATSGPGGDGLSPEAVAERYGYDPATAALTPVFELLPNYNDERAHIAEQLVVRECMKDVVELPIDRAAEDPTFFEPRTHQARKTEELAAQWGYAFHYPSFTQPEDPADTEAARAHREQVLATPEGQAALTECQAELRERLPEPPILAMWEIEFAGWEAADVDPAVLEAAAAWRVCLEPAGVIDLPEDPMNMPSRSIQEAMGIPDTGALNAPLPPASQWERDVAVADVRCRESSGWTQARWDARIQGELAAIGQDVQGFEAARLAYAEWGTRLDSVMAELG